MTEDPLDVLRAIDNETVDDYLLKREKVFGNGVISRKSKLLIALAIAVTKASVTGVEGLTKRALDEGVTWEEIKEVLHITYYIGYTAPMWTANSGFKNLIKSDK